MRHVISVHDLGVEEIVNVLDRAEDMLAIARGEASSDLLKGKVLATTFFEPSTRTRLSFESAISRLGGKIIGFTDSSSSSVSKGETLNDTIKTVSNYSDLIVMRHPIEGSARYASEVAGIPVINAGDGANQHPTQTLLDLYSIRKTQGTLDNLNIFLVGDLKYGRTVHSLVMAMSRWNTTFNFVAPIELQIPDEYKLYLDNLGLKYYEHTDFTEIISRADIIYMTRVQRERFTDPIEYEKVKNVYVLQNSMLENTKDNMRVLHPLPRVNEIDQDVDSNAKAYYFEQALNGVFTRQAILCSLLGFK